MNESHTAKVDMRVQRRLDFPKWLKGKFKNNIQKNKIVSGILSISSETTMQRGKPKFIIGRYCNNI